jgi:hypothetical protein
MMDRALLILTPVTTLAAGIFGLALCKVAARADAIGSHQRAQGWCCSERAVRSAMPAGMSLAGTNGQSPTGDGRTMGTAPVFIVDEQGEREKLIEIKHTASRIRVDTRHARDPEPASGFPERDGRLLRCLHQQRRHTHLSDGVWFPGMPGTGHGPRRLRWHDR